MMTFQFFLTMEEVIPSPDRNLPITRVSQLIPSATIYMPIVIVNESIISDFLLPNFSFCTHPTNEPTIAPRVVMLAVLKWHNYS